MATMIQTKQHIITVTCDLCCDDFQSGHGDVFMYFLEEIKTLGWTMEKRSDGLWSHYCPDCSKPENDFPEY